MTAVHALLAEAARRGVTVFRVGDRVRWRAAAPPPEDLLERLRQHKAALLRLVPDRPPAEDTRTADAPDHAVIYAALTADLGTPADRAAFAWAEQHGHPDILPILGRLERRCENLVTAGADEATYRHAVSQLVGLFAAVRNAYAAREADDAAPPAAGPWRVVVEQPGPLRPGPIRVNDCTVITDPARCVARTLADLECAVADRNAGRTTALTRLIDEYLATLAVCGVTARVEPLQ